MVEVVEDDERATGCGMLSAMHAKRTLGALQQFGEVYPPCVRRVAAHDYIEKHNPPNAHGLGNGADKANLFTAKQASNDCCNTND